MTLHPSLIGWCLVEGDPVLLDVTADRYIRFSGRPARALRMLAHGGEAPAAEDLAALDARITVGPDGIGAPCPHPLPSRALAERTGGRPRPLLVALTIARLLWTRRTLRRRGLAQLVERYMDDGTPGAHRRRRDIAVLLRAHTRTRRILFSGDACVIRAFALAGQARSHGHSVHIVFGVQLRPFAAHCWVELDGALLDDDLDHVRAFHPILVL